jgi:flagellar biosynthetic protein FliQ
VTSDAALGLILGLLRAAAYITAPALGAALVAGILVGLVQTATQVNEASLSFAFKVAAVIAVLLVMGPAMASYAVAYTRASFTGLEHVVR